MTRMVATIVGVFCVLSAASDAKEAAGPVATVDFEKGYDVGAGYGRASLQSYNLVDTEKCWKMKQIGFVTALASSRKAKRIPAGQRVQIHAHTSHDSRSMAGSCDNRIAFTPESGAHYSIKQVTAIGRYCRMEVNDASTGKAPADLEHINPASCKKPEKEKES